MTTHQHEPVIRTAGTDPALHAPQADGRGRPRPRPRGRRRRAGRLPRPQRRRQVDDAADAHHADRADRRAPPRSPGTTWCASAATSAAASGTSARATPPATPSAAATSWSARAGLYGLSPARRRTRRADELLEAFDLTEHAGAPGLHALRRPAPPARRRDRPGAHAAAAVPRRAVDRARPAEPGQPAGADPAAARRARHHDRADHALPRGGRRDRRPGGRDRPRPGDRRRHRGRAQVRRSATWSRSASPTRATPPLAAARPGRAGSPARRSTATGTDGHGPGRPRRATWRRSLVTDLAGAGAPVRRIEVVGPTLDDVFLDLTGRSLRESNDTTDHRRSRSMSTAA